MSGCETEKPGGIFMKTSSCRWPCRNALRTSIWWSSQAFAATTTKTVHTVTILATGPNVSV
ncbi:hypothetical protein A2U01_0061013, partial [Trifolium medium]|nr:hypothetical protein [Trifolium medium]